MTRIQKIVLTTDLSDASTRAFPFAGMLAASAGAQLVLVHVIDVAPQLPPGAIALPEAEEDALRTEVRSHVERHLAQLIKDHFGATSGVRHAVLEGRDAARAVCDYAREHGVDMIAVAASGHRSVSQMLLGNVAARIVRQAPCPVAVVPVA